TLEHLKRLEGEVLDTLESLGERQLLMAMEGISVDPHQLLGLELNPRAAAIAETVLWIGYLQWHFRTHGAVNPPEPVIRDFRNIQCRDAVLDSDRMEWVTDAAGRPVTRWDGRTFKPHPVTGEAVPDESAQVPQERYVNPRRAVWPAADFVVGNPPFIGAGPMRRTLGDGYVEALRGVWSTVPESADYVMYWWEQAAELTRTGALRRFGFITTNSLRQTFNRRVLERHLSAAEPLSLCYAVPDHPWVDAADGAAVRIGMTVGQAGTFQGVLERVTAERPGQGEGLEVDLERTEGPIHTDLRIGADVAACAVLQANRDISNPGVKLHGAGFIVTPNEAVTLGLGRVKDLENHIRVYLNGRDLTQTPRGVMVIDLFGLTVDEVRSRFPEVYQRVLERVKPERDQNKRQSRKDNWWLFGETNPKLRWQLAGLGRYIATVETAKHRTFCFLEQSVLPDNMLIAIALDDAWTLGVLSSRVHVLWALATGGTLEDRPRYTKTRCFETFPFPAPDAPHQARIRQLAEDLDAHRKQRQALHPGLTMTGMYNVLEHLRTGAPLSPKDRVIHEQGLVAVLRQLHDELDAAVLAAYGWDDLTAALSAPRPVGCGDAGTASGETASPTPPAAVEEIILHRLVALNAERAAEERRGLIRWLRPEFQHPAGTGAVAAELAPDAAAAVGTGPKPDWPKTLPEQFQALRAALAARAAPVTAADLAQGFTRAPRAKVAELLDTLASLGHARRLDDGRYLAG
ncbi:MAG: class I SAM-dependent DNA methyltransferase, partial [Lamprocystis purpurea]|nr:class I SAM-dependent DNA methyltransferase [Lamprocystis purpurea]